MSAFRVLLRLTTFERWLYPANIAVWAVWYSIPLAMGVIAQRFFDALSGRAPAGLNEWTLIALLLAVGAAHIASFILSLFLYFTWWYKTEALLRRNLLSGVLGMRAPLRLPYSAGEAISRFRDDVEVMLQTLDGWLDLIGQGLFTIAALVVMLRINPVITLVVTVPVAVAVAAANLAGTRVQRRRAASRKAAGRVAGFIGEVFGAVQAIKVASATPQVMTHFRRLNEERGRTALLDSLLTQIIDTINFNSVNLATGLMLLLAASAMRSGSFTVGDFALFASYLPGVVGFPRWLGRAVVRYQQSRVSVERMHALTDHPSALELARHGPVYTGDHLPEIEAVPERPDDPLRRLEVRGLTYRHPGSGRGIEGVSFALERGTFTVVTGRVGSGKTTLLHVLLGLLPRDQGEILWNGRPVADPASFFQPPRSAYTPQAPRLFSDTLRDNILLGLPQDERAVREALRTAALDRDVPHLEDGLDTVIGPRGVKLSGGQAHRAAAARMLVREAELLVFDDLSSALDVETEKLLWDRLFARRDLTCLVVSHRRAVLNRADQVIVLRDGRVDALGSLSDALRDSVEMRLLWREELREESAGAM